MAKNTERHMSIEGSAVAEIFICTISWKSFCRDSWVCAKCFTVALCCIDWGTER